MHTIDYTYLRPKKAEWLRRMYATPLELRKTLSVWQGNNATVLPLRRTVGEGLLFGRGGVIDNNGQYVPLSGFETRIMHDYPHDPPIYEDQKVVFCGYLGKCNDAPAEYLCRQNRGYCVNCKGGIHYI